MRSFVSVACATLALAGFGMVSAPAFASDALNSGDTAWILTATALVLFMTLPGLALFYAGLVQSKNIVSVLMHHFAIACLMSILWVIAGYSLPLVVTGRGLAISVIYLWVASGWTACRGQSLNLSLPPSR